MLPIFLQYTDGIIEVAPAQTTTYTLTAMGQGGEMTVTATVTVE